MADGKASGDAEDVTHVLSWLRSYVGRGARHPGDAAVITFPAIWGDQHRLQRPLAVFLAGRFAISSLV